MKRIKNLIKKILGLGEKNNNDVQLGLVYIGSSSHGYWIPSGFLNNHSVCYCVGAGDDISFDTELKTRYNSNIFIFDPTPAAKEHFMMLKDISGKNQPMPTVSQDGSYRYKINFTQLDEINFIETGVWSHKTILKFHDPGLNNYVSHSVYLFKDSENVLELPVDSIKNFMAGHGHSSVDLVKLEIEGAEYAVIDSILTDKADVKMILVEFDEIFHVKGIAHLLRIRKTCKQLEKAGYVLAHSTKSLKRTFIRKDVYNQIKSGTKN